MAFLYIFVETISVLLTVIEFLIVFRVLLDWIAFGDESHLSVFLYTVTEPFLAPARLIIEKVEFLRSMPIDFSYFISIILISIIQTLLPDFSM